jgi:hypothetical protein
MESLNLRQAQLLRLLTSIFGKDRVIPRMRIIAVCGGTLPLQQIPGLEVDLELWGQQAKCLFTIVDQADMPTLVIDLIDDPARAIDVEQLAYLQIAKVLLGAVGVVHLTLTEVEVENALGEGKPQDFRSYLEAKIEDQLNQ